MKDYMLLFRGGLDFSTATPEQLQEAMQKWRTWMDELITEGTYTGGERLVPGTGTVLSGSKKHMTDGPFAEGKEMVGGYISIKAENGTHAAEIAKGCPIFGYEGIVEVREIVSM